MHTYYLILLVVFCFIILIILFVSIVSIVINVITDTALSIYCVTWRALCFIIDILACEKFNLKNMP